MKKIVFFCCFMCFFVVLNAQNFQDYVYESDLYMSGDCYRGRIGLGFNLGYNVGNSDSPTGQFCINTTHGYQINPHIFIGGGCGLYFISEYNYSDNLDYRDATIDVPLFATVRFNFSEGRIMPLFDAKIGSIITNNSGSFLSFSLGCRIAFDENHAICPSIGYEREVLEFQEAIGYLNHSVVRVPKKQSFNNISLRIEYEF